MSLQEAIRDVADAARSYSLWSYLAWHDIRLRYRRSRLGPLWITLSMMIFIGALGLVFAKVFNTPVGEYLPFMAAGYLVWFFIATVLGEAPNVFVDNSTYLKELRINPFVILMRSITRNAIIFAHNALIMVFVYAFFDVRPGMAIVAALPGFFLVMANMTAVSAVLAIIGARFRDIAQIVQTLVQVLFFVSPIAWFPKLIGHDSIILVLNPVSYFLDLVRSPLLGTAPSITSWWVSSALLISTVVAAFALYVRKGSRVVFWV